MNSVQTSVAGTQLVMALTAAGDLRFAGNCHESMEYCAQVPGCGFQILKLGT